MSKKIPTRESYFYTVVKMNSFIRQILTNLVIRLSVIPQMMAAVLFRKDLGERFFSLSSFILILFFFSLPVFFTASPMVREGLNYMFGFNPFNISFLLFYGFLIYQAIQRRKDFNVTGSEVRVDRFSYYDGENGGKIWDMLMERFPKLNTKDDYKKARKNIEPLIFIITGVILMVLIYPLMLGIFLIISGVILRFGVMAQYQKGRDYMLDKVDEIIADEEMANVILGDKSAQETRGFRVFADMPEEKGMREKLVEKFMTTADEDAVFAE